MKGGDEVLPPPRYPPARELGQPSWFSHFPADSLGNVGFWAAPLKVWLCVSRMGRGNLLFSSFKNKTKQELPSQGLLQHVSRILRKAGQARRYPVRLSAHLNPGRTVLGQDYFSEPQRPCL